MNNDTYQKFLSLSEEDQSAVMQFMDFLLALEALEKDNRSRKKAELPECQQTSAALG